MRPFHGLFFHVGFEVHLSDHVIFFVIAMRHGLGHIAAASADLAETIWPMEAWKQSGPDNFLTDACAYIVFIL